MFVSAAATMRETGKAKHDIGRHITVHAEKLAHNKFRFKLRYRGRYHKPARLNPMAVVGSSSAISCGPRMRIFARMALTLQRG